MLDPEGQPGQPPTPVQPQPMPPDPVPASPGMPDDLSPRTYDVPTARQVVSAGLQLAVASSSAIRRASIYIGLLALGAFGPMVVALFVGIGRLLGDPEIAESLAIDPFRLFVDHPELAEPFRLVAALGIIGLVLLVAISIDAQAIAISLLAGVAADRPLSLAEAVSRARQTFWRLLGAGFVVGLTSGVVSLLVTVPFGGAEANAGVSFFGSMVGTLLVTPWAFAATGIVLGDVGAIDTLQRSVTLFRAARAIALVVILFTLLTAAIQSFALGAGLDVAVRIGELFGFGLDQGPAGLILPAILVLAFVVAFGSLTFTVAAIVAAPQVVAFLGLTFHSGGLDRARSAPGARRGPFHWVAPPMAVTMLALVALAAVGLASVRT